MCLPLLTNPRSMRNITKICVMKLACLILLKPNVLAHSKQTIELVCKLTETMYQYHQLKVISELPDEATNTQ